ncbi:MAG: hypothetical protein WDM77_13665 [Steroidobacteraceae bacterium]
MKISRRDAVVGAFAASVVANAVSAQTPGKLEPTGQETLGPFYPVRAPVSHDMDLTHYPGRQAAPWARWFRSPAGFWIPKGGRCRRRN